MTTMMTTTKLGGRLMPPSPREIAHGTREVPTRRLPRELSAPPIPLCSSRSRSLECATRGGGRPHLWQGLRPVKGSGGTTKKMESDFM